MDIEDEFILLHKLDGHMAGVKVRTIEFMERIAVLPDFQNQEDPVATKVCLSIDILPVILVKETPSEIRDIINSIPHGTYR